MRDLILQLSRSSIYSTKPGGTFGAASGQFVCVALGIGTGPIGYLTCSLVGAAVGGYVAGEVGGWLTGFTMDKIL
ncbi:hypothetical protein JK229_20490 [Pantoea dispersa]|nr:hypothetical protein [Pantoea dispersa]